jgi:hypothetical protein
MKFFKPKYIGKHGTTGWRSERWSEALDRYSEHLDAIRARLAPDILEIDRLRLHDLPFDEIEWKSSAWLRIRLDWLDLHFVGVCDCKLPDGLLDSAWLYAEIHLDPCGFRLEVLCDGAVELQVSAKRFSAYDTLQKKWVVGQDPRLWIGDANRRRKR